MAIPQRKTLPTVKGVEAAMAVLDKALELAKVNPSALPGYGPEQGNPITLAPRIPEASVMAEKMTTNAGAAGERWLAGVTSPKKDPISQMKKAAGTWKNAMQAAISSGSWEKAVAAIDEDEMYKIIREGGAGVFTSGISRRKGKIEKAYGLLRPKLLALASVLDAMPTDTDAAREAKMIAARRGMIKIGQELKGAK